MFRLVPDPRGQRDLDSLARFFNTLGVRISGSDKEEIADAVHAGFAQNFVMQASGAGPWAALKPRTVEQRRRLGFPGTRPILYRTGDYRDTFTEGGDPEHFSQAWNSSNRFVLEEGSESPLFPFHEGGTGTMAHRSVTDLTTHSERHIGDVIDDMLRRLMRSEGL